MENFAILACIKSFGCAEYLNFNSLATKGANIMDEKIAKLKEWIDGSDNIVFSAVRAYRPRAAFQISARWTVCTTSSNKYPPETILSHTFFLSETEEFYRFYRAKIAGARCKSRTRLTSSWPSGNARASVVPL